VRSDDERRQQLGREAPYLLNFIDATAMMSVHGTLYTHLLVGAGCACYEVGFARPVGNVDSAHRPQAAR